MVLSFRASLSYLLTYTIRMKFTFFLLLRNWPNMWHVTCSTDTEIICSKLENLEITFPKTCYHSQTLLERAEGAFRVKVFLYANTAETAWVCSMLCTWCCPWRWSSSPRSSWSWQSSLSVMPNIERETWPSQCVYSPPVWLGWGGPGILFS